VRALEEALAEMGSRVGVAATTPAPKASAAACEDASDVAARADALDAFNKRLSKKVYCFRRTTGGAIKGSSCLIFSANN
jgi:hypothetical protein